MKKESDNNSSTNKDFWNTPYDFIVQLCKFLGIGGAALGICFIIINNVLEKNIFHQLTQEQTSILLNKIVIGCFILAFIGIFTYVIEIVLKQRRSTIKNARTEFPEVTSPKNSEISTESLLEQDEEDEMQKAVIEEGGHFVAVDHLNVGPNDVLIFIYGSLLDVDSLRKTIMRQSNYALNVYQSDFKDTAVVGMCLLYSPTWLIDREILFQSIIIGSHWL